MDAGLWHAIALDLFIRNQFLTFSKGLRFLRCWLSALRLSQSELFFLGRLPLLRWVGIYGCVTHRDACFPPLCMYFPFLANVVLYSPFDSRRQDPARSPPVEVWIPLPCNTAHPHADPNPVLLPPTPSLRSWVGEVTPGTLTIHYAPQSPYSTHGCLNSGNKG